MFKNLTLPQKVAAGFGVVVGLVLVMGIINLLGLNKIYKNATYIVNDRIPVADMTMETQIAILKARDSMGEFLSHENNFDKIATEFKEYISEARKTLKEEASLNQTEEEVVQSVLNLIDRFEQEALQMQQAYRKAVKFKVDAANLMEISDAAFNKLLDVAKKAGFSLKEYDLINEMSMAVNDFLITGDETEIQNFNAAAEKLKVSSHFNAIKSVFEEAYKKGMATISTYQNYFKAKKAARAAMTALDETSEKIITNMEKLESNVYEGIEKLKTEAKRQFLKIFFGTIAILVIIAGFAGFMGLNITKGIKENLHNVVNRIRTTLEQTEEKLEANLGNIVSASGIVSSTSQQLAEGTSEQAASLEETSASMEEITSMAKQNADNALQTDQLMKETQQVVKNTEISMKELTGFMEDMAKLAEETQKIVKSIDEIAFQTNLLALNAAVEAARAGEAGMGFAVVADEVRNLAQRTAAAAKDTAHLIEQTVKGIHTNLELVKKVNTEFNKLEESATKVASLVAEIAAASQEQTQGISQVNVALTQLDKAVQNIAANSEELSSATQELNTQTEKVQEVFKESMISIIEELKTLVGEDTGKNITVLETAALRTTEPKALPGRKSSEEQ